MPSHSSSSRPLQPEPVDPKPQIEKACHPVCVKPFAEYEKCKDRIAKKGSGSCEPWMMDYWQCIDKCVSNACLSEQTGPRSLTASAAAPAIISGKRICLEKVASRGLMAGMALKHAAHLNDAFLPLRFQPTRLQAAKKIFKELK